MLNKNIIAFIFVLSLYTVFFPKVNAQGNLPYADDKLIHFGFSLGLNTADFGITPNDTLINGNRYFTSVSALQPGFSVGVISNLRLARYWNLRFNPTLHFSGRDITYRKDTTLATGTTTVNSIPLSFPVYLKYSAERKNNYRPYLLGGGGVYFDFGRNKEKPILLKPMDYFIEFGAGCDLYFSFFKLAPELKFAIGFNNMLTPLEQRNAGGLTEEDKIYTTSISKLTNKMITLSFNFE